eukprot:TRINITY_DN8528_c0_g1_i1.p1 TRINITY_DN8528_c0_g1~~TRINITY_DN8528_c0_g1_i1.p1  ORF type:complete len:555 (+),score=73.91 TRINITY_DN8528_c0_g1_i1:91-1755(+)
MRGLCMRAIFALLLFSVRGERLDDDPPELQDLDTRLLQARLKMVTLSATSSNLSAASNSSANVTDQQQILQRLQLAPTNWKFPALIGFICLYAMAALSYEAASGPDEAQKESRVLEWDAVRLFMQVAIVASHVQKFVMIDADGFTGGWANIATTLLIKPTVARQTFEHLTNFGEWLVFGYDGLFRMPTFAFISGVFGQKVDKATLLRVICYTFGTYYIVMLFFGCMHLASGGAVRSPPLWGTNPYWYLVDLFLWRVTLSPLFAAIKDRTLTARIAAFVAVSVVSYGCYDFFGHLEPALFSLRSRTALAVPQSECFALGPFFALGLVLPHRRWTELLRSRRLQTIALFALAALYGGLLNPTYRAWLQESFIDNHWPTATNVSQTLKASRLAEHCFWFLYKVSASLAVIWVVALLTPLFVRLAPTAAPALLSGGSRSMYSYVLHVGFLTVAVDVFEARKAVQGMQGETWCLDAWIAAAVMVLLLTSRLTEKLFGPVVMPFWLLHVFAALGLSVDNTSMRHAGKAPADSAARSSRSNAPAGSGETPLTAARPEHAGA